MQPATYYGIQPGCTAVQELYDTNQTDEVSAIRKEIEAPPIAG